MRAYGEALPSLPLSYAKIVRKDRTFYDPADRKKKQTIRRVRQEYGLILPFRSVGNEHKEQTVMSVLTFDKKELGNLEYSLQREMLATDRRGGYMSTTIVCCNTRKYHGLMVAPIDDSDRAYVLLSSVDETVVHDGQSFNLALHRFPGTYEPRGHKYITDFEYTPTPTITYRVGSIVLRKELLWIHNRTQLMIRYTLLEAPAFLRLPGQTCAHACQYGGRRTFPADSGRGEVSVVFRFSLAVPANRLSGCGVRAGSRLVL